MVNHYSKREWMDYIAGECNPDRSFQLEQHLYQCDHCLRIYMEAAEAQAEMPEWKGMELAIEKIAGKETKPAAVEPSMMQNGRDRHDSPRKWLLPYIAAASATLLLTSAGVFEALLFQTEELLPMADLLEQDKSYSEQAVQAVTDWLDAILRRR